MDRNGLKDFFYKKVWEVNSDVNGQGRSYGWHAAHWNDLLKAIDEYADARVTGSDQNSDDSAESAPSKSSALVWAAQQAVKADPSWEDDLSWRLGNEDRYMGIGLSEEQAVIDAMRGERLTWNVGPYLKPSGEVDWALVVKDIRHGAMTEFITTPYGVLMMDCG